MKMYTKYDSLKIKINDDGLLWLNETAFKEYQNHKFVSGLGEVPCFDPSKINIGINRIYWRPFEESFVIELSAKLLRKDYPTLISIDTYDEMIFEFNKSNSFIKLDPVSTLEEGLVLSATPCQDLLLAEHPKVYIQHLNLLPLKGQYELKEYSPESIGIKHRTAKKSFYFKAYDKFYDATNSKGMSKFDLELLGYYDTRKFERKLRIETDIKNFSDLRRFLSLPKGDPRLIDVLTSKSPANYLAINEVISSRIPVIPSHFEIDSISAERDYIYNEYLNKKNEGDDKKVRTHLKMMSVSQSKSAYFPYQQRYLKHKLLSGKSIRPKDDQYIQEVMKRLQKM